MGSCISNHAQFEAWNAYFSGKDVRVIPVMSNTTAGSSQDADFISDITTLDELDDANYTSPTSRVALTGEAVTEDDANDRAKFTVSAAISITGLAGDYSRPVVGLVFEDYIGADSANRFIYFHEFTTPIAVGKNTINVPLDTIDLLRFAQAA